MVFDGRSGEHDAAGARAASSRRGPGPTAVLDRLRFVQHDQRPRDLRKPLLPPQHAVGRDHQIERRQCAAGSPAMRANSSASVSERCAKNTRSDGANRASSCRQLPISEAGTTKRLGPCRPPAPSSFAAPPPLARRASEGPSTLARSVSEGASTPALCTRRSPPALQQQINHLNRFAQSHVVGEARSQAKLGHEPQPAHALDLIGPQRGLQIAAWLARPIGCGCRMRSSVCRSQSPAVTRDQFATCSSAALASPNSAPAKSRIPSMKLIPSGRSFADLLPMIERLLQFFLIDFDPFAAQSARGPRCLPEVGGARHRSAARRRAPCRR